MEGVFRRSSKIARANNRSSGVVTFRLLRSPRHKCTCRPENSMSWQSSVKSWPAAWALAKAVKYSSRKNTWGVCTARREARSGVWETSSPSPTSLMVSTTGTAREEAPQARASTTTWSISSGVTRGRAPSWMATRAAPSAVFTPSRTDSCRVAPPGTTARTLAKGAVIRSTMSWSSKRHTTTISCICRACSNARRVWQSSGSPSSSINCFGVSPPIREELPAATIIPQT